MHGYLNMMLASSLVMTAFFAVSCNAATQNVTKKWQIDTTYGPVFTESKTNSSGILAFKNIPYAKPPVGDLRWRSPMPPDPWEQPLNATTFKQACYTFYHDPLDATLPQSEDCLYLNIWTKDTAALQNERRPVMFWIHGGTFEIGAASAADYDGTHLAERDVVLVSIDYRLGNFGFLARTDLDAEDTSRKSGMFGVQDMLLALQWVKENIENFGGDPDNVSLFGQSAGAHVQGLLMSSPLARGLFHKGIMESGSWRDSEHGAITAFDQARSMGDKWGSSNASLADLRAMSAEAVVNASLWSPNTDPAVIAFAPAIDNYVLKNQPASVFVAGNQIKVPLLAGWNENEDTFFEGRALPHSTAEEFEKNLIAFFNVSGKNLNETISSLQNFYPYDTDEQANQSARLWIRDLVNAQQTWQTVDVNAQTNPDNASFAYHFSFTSAFTPVAGHTAEIAYVFNNYEPQVPIPGFNETYTPSAVDIAMGEKMATYWTNFAKSSDPNVPDNINGSLPYWPQYQKEGQVGCTKANQILELGKVIAVSEFNLSRFEFLASFRDEKGVLPKEWRGFKAI